MLKKLKAKHKPRFNKLADWLRWQEGLHFKSIELGLDRCRAVAKKMGLLDPGFAVISVAGTNGKGSSVAMLDAILNAAGYRTGCYTSPHLVHYNERVRIQCRQVDDATLCDAFDRIDQARGNISLTYFEFGTLAALDIFNRENIDIAILEVGLGGRLDAGNILEADVALVSTIELDHEFWLGKNRESIALEKAGIFRPETPAVCSDPNPPRSMIKHAQELNTPLDLLNQDYKFIPRDGCWDWKTLNVELRDLPRPCPYNYYQMQNAAGVLRALRHLHDTHPVSESAIHEGLRQVKFPGRFQVLPGDICIILDVAHNQNAAHVLAENIRSLGHKGKNHVLIGMLNDKDHSAVFKELQLIADSWHIVELDSERKTGCDVLLEELNSMHDNKPRKTHEKISRAIRYIKQHADVGDQIIVTGSFLTVGEALRHLQRDIRLV
ncbi:MAG: bifunctional tetrahydrofolate synthase/dihydrofolate synthase [Thiotrichales bacterium]|nr:bifunctional tetrahydrofolate synthase/dihydrofolate synthase [Thiotrichales bacterium]